jgi:hypothetical protein
MHPLSSGVTIGVSLLKERRARPMADLAYAVLLIAIFAVLALTLRGLERM